MRPTGDSPVYRPDLGVVVNEYWESRKSGFIGLEVMPPYPVFDASGTFPVIPAEVMLKIPDTKRGSRSAYNRSNWEYEDGKYSCSEHGHEEPSSDRERKVLDRRAPGLADSVATMRGLRIIDAAQEQRVANKLFNSTNFTVHAVTNEWDDYTNGTPVSDTNDGVVAFRSQCGMLPDALVLSWTAFKNARRCAEVVSQLKYTFPGLDINKITAEQLASVLDVPRILVGNVVYDSADMGQAKSITDIWSNEYAALVKISKGEDLAVPGVGRTFIFAQDTADMPIVESYREEQIRSDVFRVRHDVDERLIQSFDDDGAVKSNIASSCVYLMSNITT